MGAAALMALSGFQVMARGEACLPDAGNPPRPITKSLQGSFSSYFSTSLACVSRGGEVLTLNDPDGTQRTACLRVPGGTSPMSQRPLVTFLGAARYSGNRQAYASGLDALADTEYLSGDPTHRGFILLVIEGRDTEHYYPAPADKGTGWDNWYRNLNRNDPALNVDVATIDQFIASVEDRGIVDPRRKYMMGWSNGGAMALLYGMNTRGIAATAVYSSPNPYADQFDPCPQAPFARNKRPLATLHNSCDVFGICDSGSVGFNHDVTSTLRRVPLTSIIIDSQQRRVESCDASCSYDVKAGGPGARRGAVAHTHWPRQWNDDFMAFLRANPLPPPAPR